MGSSEPGNPKNEDLTPYCVLVCEDHPAIAGMLQELLSFDGFTVVWARNKQEALDRLAEGSPDLLLLDLLLPDSETAGWELLAEARQRTLSPIIVISGLGRSANRVRALHEGADDYITKPFSPEEVRARIHAVLRRGKPRSSFANLVVDDARKEVLVKGRPVSLSPKEFLLLRLLASSHGEAVATADILRELWSPSAQAPPTSQDVQKYVYLLRKKVEEDPSNPRLVLTVRGIGYRLAV